MGTVIAIREAAERKGITRLTNSLRGHGPAAVGDYVARVAEGDKVMARELDRTIPQITHVTDGWWFHLKTEVTGVIYGKRLV